MIAAKNAFWPVILILALVMSMVTENSALADEPAPNIFVSSQQIACGEYLASASSDRQFLGYANAWIEGYLAGYNTYVDHKRLILAEDVRNIVGWIERFCERNKTKRIYDAIRLFFEELGPVKE